MPANEDHILPSTTFKWIHAKIDSPPAAPTAQPRRDRSKPALAHWSGRNPITIQVRYRGGAEAWYEVRGRGRVWRVTGDTDIHSVMEAVYGRGKTASEE